MMKIGTHNGVFHCDEALACAILKTLPRFKDAKIIRTRDQAVLDTCDIVVDVGGVFDHESKRYDHHQKTFTETMSSLGKGPWVTKLSSAGLIYAFYGKEAIAQLVNKTDEKLLDKVYAKVYENFIEEIDGMDNGVSAYEGLPKYKVTTTLSHRVGYLCPSWQSKHQNFEAGFVKAMNLVLSEFKDRVKFYSKDWWPARDLVSRALQSRFEVHASGRIIVLKSGGCPFKEHLYELEEEQEISGQILFVMYMDFYGSWTVLAVGVKDKMFESRMSLHKEWNGLRNQELSDASEIDGCVFIHATGFIGSNKTRDGALKMAVRTIELSGIVNGK